MSGLSRLFFNGVFQTLAPFRSSVYTNEATGGEEEGCFSMLYERCAVAPTCNPGGKKSLRRHAFPFGGAPLAAFEQARRHMSRMTFKAIHSLLSWPGLTCQRKDSEERDAKPPFFSFYFHVLSTYTVTLPRPT